MQRGEGGAVRRAAERPAAAARGAAAPRAHQRQDHQGHGDDRRRAAHGADRIVLGSGDGRGPRRRHPASPTRPTPLGAPRGAARRRRRGRAGPGRGRRPARAPRAAAVRGAGVVGVGTARGPRLGGAGRRRRAARRRYAGTVSAGGRLPDAEEAVVQGALRVAAETGPLQRTWSRAPLQAVARLHTLAAADARAGRTARPAGPGGRARG